MSLMIRCDNPVCGATVPAHDQALHEFSWIVAQRLTPTGGQVLHFDTWECVNVYVLASTPDVGEGT